MASDATRPPITYLITNGATVDADCPRGATFVELLALVRRAVEAGVSLIQLREKRLSGRALYELSTRAAEIARQGSTRILVNDRADVSRAAGCDGVHLTTRSLAPSTVRRSFGPDFTIGVSTHTLEEASEARAGGADFAVFGPVFDTPSKRELGRPVGLHALREASDALEGFPLVALGGVSVENAREVFAAGARGVAAIRMFSDGQNLARVLHHIHEAAASNSKPSRA